MLLKSTFKLGGVHAPENKSFSAHQPITEVELPEQVAINLNQHIGKKARAVVEKKQEISVGDVIGEADGFVSAFIHSPVSGTIKKIDSQMTAVGVSELTIIIDVDKEKTLEDDKKYTTRKEVDFDSLGRDQLLEVIQKAGIVGQGGATFPMHVKLNPPKEKNVDMLILNGAECEPYLTSDHQLMLEKTEEILIGSRIMAKVLGIKDVVIGVEENKPDAINAFLEIIKKPEFTGFKVASLQTKYPQGGEKQLIQAVTGREVPSGGLPFDVGVIVHNVGTAYAAYEALYYDKPFIDRVTTVTGYVNKPGNYRTRIGTRFEHLIENAAGGFKDPEHVRSVINGGPMMGKSVRQLDVSVMKGTGGIVALSDKEFYYEEERACIRCARCIEQCPMGLMPVSLADDTILKRGENLLDSLDCIECGICSYVCPTDRKLVHWIRMGKSVYKDWKTKQEKIGQEQ